jgi:hypothetical protein
MAWIRDAPDIRLLEAHGGDMLEQLRGRNLSHVGCTIGLTFGLIVGLIVALVIISLVRADTATNLATAAWLSRLP